MISFKQYLKEQKEKSFKTYFDDLWDGTKIFIVDGQYVRNTFYVDFTEGGHGQVYNFIPKNEIWIELLQGLEDNDMTLLHEISEYVAMKYLKYNYEKAHAKAANIESLIRKLNMGVKDFNKKTLKKDIKKIPDIEKDAHINNG